MTTVTNSLQAENILAKDFLDYMSGNTGLTATFVQEIMRNEPSGQRYQILSGATSETNSLGSIVACQMPKGKALKVFENQEGLLITRKGKAGTVRYLEPGFYTLTDDGYILFPLKETEYEIDIQWLEYAVRDKTKIGINGTKKGNATWGITTFLNNARFDIPVLDDQKQYVQRMREIEAAQEPLRQRLEEISQMVPCVELDGFDFLDVQLDELFKHNRGNSKYTRTWCNKHQGEYEVFTGTTIGHFAFINNYDYEGRKLSFTTDGEHAGTVSILDGRYSVGAHRAILTPLNDNLDIEYFKYVLRQVMAKSYKKGDVPSISWGILKKKLVQVPIDKNGNYSKEIQQAIAAKYRTLETIIHEAEEMISETLSIKPEIG